MKKILSIIMIALLSVSQVSALTSDGVIYDNSESGSSATNVKDALNDLYSKLNQKQEEINSINNIGNAASNHILNGYTAYVKGKTVTGSIPSKGATTYTPGTTNQTIGVGNYISGVQTIKGDANLVAGNIAKGKSIFGVAGTYTSDANAVAADILSGKTAYVNGSKITGTMANQTGATGLTLTSTDKRPVKIVTKGSSDARIWYLNNSDGVQRLNIGVPSYGYYDTNVTLAIGNTDIANALGINASKVAKGQTIAGVSGTYTSDANAVAGNILSGKTAYVNGSKITGTIASKGATTYTPGTSNQTIAAGNYLSGTQTIKGDANLVAANIAKGKSIFGVSGSYTSDATATAADIASGKTAYVNGSKITGTSGGNGKILKEFRVNQNVEYSFTVNENVSEMILIGTQVKSNYLTVKVNGTVISGTTSLIENERYGTFHFNISITSGSTISIVDKGGSYTYFWAIKLK